MKKQLLSNMLGAILFTAICAPASMLFTSCAANPKANTNQPANANRSEEAGVYKFKEAGIPFTVPAGWEAKAEASAAKASPKTGGQAQTAFIVLPVATDMGAAGRH